MVFKTSKEQDQYEAWLQYESKPIDEQLQQKPINSLDPQSLFPFNIFEVMKDCLSLDKSRRHDAKTLRDFFNQWTLDSRTPSPITIMVSENPSLSLIQQ